MVDTGRTEEMCRKMDELAKEDHTHHITPEEIPGYRANWWIRSNKVGSGTMPVRHRPDFKQALSTLRQLKDLQFSSKFGNCLTAVYCHRREVARTSHHKMDQGL